MKKILIGLFLLLFTFSISYSQAKDLHKYSTQEVLNIVLNDPASAIYFHHYSTQEVLNIALDETNSALKAKVEGISIDVDGRIVVDGLVVIDPTSLAGESLDEVDFASHAEWTATNDIDNTFAGNNAEYVFTSNQTSTLTQIQASLVIAGVADVYYKFTYTVAVTTAFDGDGAATITTAFALTAVSLDLTAGTHTIYFRSASVPTDFIISIVSGSDLVGEFTIDDVTLKQITGGRVDIAGDLWVNGVDLVAAIGAGTDDQKIDVFAIAGDNVQLSLESDGEATKTVDISSTTTVAANKAHITADGSSHSFIGQDVTTSGAPTFDKLTVTNATSTDVSALPVYVSETLSGTFGASTPAYGMTVYSKILGANLGATDAYESAITGLYGITGTNASVYPKASVLGWIADNTTTADGAFIALIDGDTQITQAGAAFGVRHLNSTATSGFNYGLDLYGAAIGGYNAVSYRTADIRLGNGAIFDNSSTSLLTITEATVDIEGALTATTLGSDGEITAIGHIQGLTGGFGITRTEGTVHIHTATAGAATASGDADDLVVENSDNVGASFIAPDDKEVNLYFATPGDIAGAIIRWDYGTAGANKDFHLGSATTGGSTIIVSGNFINAITADGNQDVTINAGDFTVEAGDLAVTDGNIIITLNVNDVTISNGGSGYTAGALIFSGGGGSGAAGTYTVTTGEITGITLTNSGTGYTSAPTVTPSDAGDGNAVLLVVVNDNRLILPINDDPAHPGIDFGGFGIYPSADNVIRISINDAKAWEFSLDDFRGSGSSRVRLVGGVNSISSVPVILPNGDDATTGLGRAGIGQLSLIVKSKEGTRISEGNNFISSITGHNVAISITDATTDGSTTINKGGAGFDGGTVSVGDVVLIYAGGTTSAYGTYIVVSITDGSNIVVDRNVTGSNNDVDFQVLADGVVIENATDIVNHKTKLHVPGGIEMQCSALTMIHMADATLQYGMIAMVSAGTDMRFDVNDANGDEPIGIVAGVGATVQGVGYGLAILGMTHVIPEVDIKVERGDVVHSSSTAGYAEFNATITIAEIDEQVGHTAREEDVTATISGSGGVNTGTEVITLGVDVAALGWVVGDPVVYYSSGGADIGGLTSGWVYWLLSVSTTNVTISATKGGSIVNLTDDGDDDTQYLQRLPLIHIQMN